MANAEYYFEKDKSYIISFDTPNTGVQVYLQSQGKGVNYTYEKYSTALCDGKRHSFKVTAIETKVTKVTWGLILRETTTNNTDSGLLSNLMIEKVENSSTTSTDYEEHQEDNYILPIQQEMLNGDYFELEEDGWKEVHGWNKLTFTGNENLNKSGSATDEVFVATLDINDGIEEKGYSNYFKYSNGIAIGNFLVYNNGSNIRFCVDGTEITTIEQFKVLLQQKNSEGNPLYVFYKSATPTKLACTEEQSAVLDKLNNLDLFKNTNNIITTEDIALLKLNYVVDTKTYVDNKIANMQEELDTINQLLSTTQTSSILLDNLQTDLEGEVM